MDPLLDTDWAASWTQVVEARQGQARVFHDPNYWDARAKSFAAGTSSRRDGFIELMEPWLGPQKTLIDVGAGAGRYAAPLAERLDWVTAVEPSQGMRELIPSRDNMTVIATDWERAEPAVADLVICCHVLYGVAEATAFIAKLEAVARQRVFIQLRHGQLRTPSDPLWELMVGTPRARQPQFADLWNLLEQLGIRAEVGVLEYQGSQSWADAAEFLAEYRPPLEDHWDEARARDWMEANLEIDADGRLVYGRGLSTSGVAHWRPRA
ncbi:MAG TPA: class I SAM-dependent methyltransferase [Candidatus Dormibacteraeota bacterium]|nr:class I SAM-dependent methyltransferase [Candidatus Dormibacteraeota bacterium]